MSNTSQYCKAKRKKKGTLTYIHCITDTCAHIIVQYSTLQCKVQCRLQWRECGGRGQLAAPQLYSRIPGGELRGLGN